MTTSLASVDDVQARRIGTFTDEQASRVENLLADASGAVRAHTGQGVSRQVHTATVRPTWRSSPRYDTVAGGYSGTVRLPQAPVTAVTAVVDQYNTACGFQWDGLELTVGNLGGASINASGARTRGPVVVTYTAGYDPVPDEIVAIVCGMVLRAFGVKPEDAGYTKENIEGYGYELGSAAAAGAVGLLPAEKAILDAVYPPRSGVTWQR